MAGGEARQDVGEDREVRIAQQRVGAGKRGLQVRLCLLAQLVERRPGEGHARSFQA